MMWWLFNKVFGVHYASVTYGYSDHVRRVRFDGDNRPYVKIHCELIHLDSPGHHKVTPLTFSSDWLQEVGKPDKREINLKVVN